MDLALVEPRPERVDRAGAARVRPHVDGCDGAVPRVEAEEPVPEGREADGADLARAGEHGVDAGGGRLEQPGRVVLDAAVGRRPGLVGRPVLDARGAGAVGAVEARASRRGADVEGEDHRVESLA
ncbi:MAG: hypothetical protein DME06_18850 [Candidatus Rokuibacteriota bacterium]|nr:MAG: hypothetical protein DME06_18850 [Candidatus Rokubacteria bacterium]